VVATAKGHFGQASVPPAQRAQGDREI